MSPCDLLLAFQLFSLIAADQIELGENSLFPSLREIELAQALRIMAPLFSFAIIGGAIR